MKNKNDIIELEIIDIGHKGESIGKYNGITVFVEGGAIIGDFVEAEVVKSKSNYIVANLKRIIKKSDLRVDSPCIYSDLCGGCQIMHMNYKEQLKMKENQVKNAIQRIGKINDFELLEIKGMESPFNYRNKSQMPIGITNGKVEIGFYKTRSHEIINIDKCLIQDNYNELIIRLFRDYLNEFPNEVYDEILKTGNIRRIVTKTGIKTNEVMIIIVTKEEYIKDKEKLIDNILNAIPAVRTIIQNVNNSVNNNVLGVKNKTIYGDGIIEDYLEDIIFEISPNSFFQVNPVQTLEMYNTALEFAEINELSTVIDLYCGLGSISLFFARKAKMVYGVEIVEAAILDANKNAIKNNMSNKTKFICGKTEDELPKLYESGVCADVIVLDPPRKGCEESVLDTIATMGCNRIVYISCNVSTMARDIAILSNLGFKLKKLQPIDNFCHSMHIECVGLLIRE